VVTEPHSSQCPSCGAELPQDFRFCGYCGVALGPAEPARAVHRTITVLFCDLKGSTTLGESFDSESLREVTTRYFERIRGVIEAHGGEIEKFIGDAVMAVFGLPQQREDDALRAVRCAAEMKRALAELNRDFARIWGITLTNRTGVNTGEVVLGDATRGERLVGDAINVAARLEQAASANEILIGPRTHGLVRGLVHVEELEPLTLKGKAEPVPAFRLESPTASAVVAEGAQTPLVGREAELGALERALAESIAKGGCKVVTVLGEPGVGKSRLVEEFGKRAGESARLVEGRCLSYGRGITFWPIVEIVNQAADVGDEDSPETVLAKLVELTGDALVAQRVAAATGYGEGELAVEEVFWGIRKLIEAIARDRPLVVVVQDLHWAEPTLLDLVEHLHENVAAPVLLVAPARPELDAIRPELEANTDAIRIELHPLSGDTAETLVDALLGEGIGVDVRRRIADAADGNPLFVEQLVSMLVDEGFLRLEDGTWSATRDLGEMNVPPSLQALLGARLDQLQPRERAVLEPASVIGTVFPRQALEALVAEELRPELDLRLSSLSVKHLIREELAHTLAGESYRFGHVHIRQAAYDRLLKRERAVLHERFVDWGERLNRERGREAGFEELLAYHLEQAHLHLKDLGPLDAHGRELGARAAAHLIATGRRALGRGDMPAAATLLQRAAVILPRYDAARLELLPELAEALADVGEFESAHGFLDEAVEGASAGGDEKVGARARLMRLHVESQAGESQDWAGQVQAEVERAIPIFERDDDHSDLATAWRMLAWAHGTQCRYRDATRAAERAYEAAGRAGDHRQRRRAASQYAIAALYGPMPVEDAIVRCEEVLAESEGDGRTVGLVTSVLARLHAMRGEFDVARDLYVRARHKLEEMGRSVLASSTALDSCGVEMLAGEPHAAELELRRDFQALTDMGERYLLSTISGELARSVYAQGRYEEALELSYLAEKLSAADDISSQALWRRTRGMVLARRGESAPALALAREAVELLHQTDASDVRDEGLVDLAEVMHLSGDSEAAAGYLREALALFERKGNVAAQELARRRLAELPSPRTAGALSG
jgi:class 3 adenylate cyclase/tetratricopeptide (TPR) repeat protein